MWLGKPWIVLWLHPTWTWLLSSLKIYPNLQFVNFVNFHIKAIWTLLRLGVQLGLKLFFRYPRSFWLSSVLALYACSVPFEPTYCELEQGCPWTLISFFLIANKLLDNLTVLDMCFLTLHTSPSWSSSCVAIFVMLLAVTSAISDTFIVSTHILK